MKLEQKLINFSIPLMLLFNINVFASEGAYYNWVNTFKKLYSIDNNCRVFSKNLYQLNGQVAYQFKLPGNKINKTLRNNKRIDLENSKKFSGVTLETTQEIGNPFRINCSNNEKKAFQKAFNIYFGAEKINRGYWYQLQFKNASIREVIHTTNAYLKEREQVVYPQKAFELFLGLATYTTKLEKEYRDEELKKGIFALSENEIHENSLAFNPYHRIGQTLAALKKLNQKYLTSLSLLKDILKGMPINKQEEIISLFTIFDYGYTQSKLVQLVFDIKSINPFYSSEDIFFSILMQNFSRLELHEILRVTKAHAILKLLNEKKVTLVN